MRPARSAPADQLFVDPRPSKSRLKQQMHDLQALGADLVELPETRLADTPMPDGLRLALAEYRRTKSHEGKRRQMQYIGKQMRFADAQPLREAVASFKLGSARDTLHLHQAEQWREELSTDDAALTRWASAYPRCDLQRLRSLVRAARIDGAKPVGQRLGKAWRELFQFIKPWLAEPAVAADAAAEFDIPHNDHE